MKLLAVETATEACSAALLVGGEVLERFEVAPQAHNRLILPMIESLLAEAELGAAQLDALAFGRGPGSFTGVRIAVGVAQGLAMAMDLPVAPVSTLAALAAQCFDENPGFPLAYPCIDARMGEIYWGVYAPLQDALVESREGECLVSPSEVALASPWTGPAAGIGSGWGTYGQILRERLASQAPQRVVEGGLPRAAWIARLGAAMVSEGGCVPVEQARPVYLRDRVAKKMSGEY